MTTFEVLENDRKAISVRNDEFQRRVWGKIDVSITYHTLTTKARKVGDYLPEN